MRKDRIVVVAGGTGGHISPGIAIAEAACARGLDVIFLSIPRNRKYPEFLNPAEWRMAWYGAPAMKKDLRAIVRFMPDFALAFVKAVLLLRREQPLALVALGGYPCLPALLAAVVLGVPFFLCEQNAIPGRVTRAFASRARDVFLTFPSIDLPGATLTGNPVRRSLRERAKKRRAVSKEPVVLALGGSQGAVQLNDMLRRLWTEHGEFALKFHWILQSGRGHEAAMQRVVDGLRPVLRRRIEVFGFDPDIFRYFERATVFAGRAGAGNITEAALFGLPMVLLPYPFAKDGHQKANARCAVDARAGFMIDRLDSDPSELVAALRAITERRMLSSARKASLAMASPGAAATIVDRMLGVESQAGK